jgi:hypothetical protein
MKKWLRRIRGGVGIGLTWAFAWFGAGMVVLLAIAVSGGEGADVPFPVMWGLLGFLAGVMFSVILGTVEGSRMLDQVSVPRFAMWGAFAGLLLSAGLVLVAGLIGEALLLGPLFALTGAACAAGTLVLARRADNRESLSGSGDFADGRTLEAEERDLLGGTGLGDPPSG